MKMVKHYDRFTTYSIISDPSGVKSGELATVPEQELQDLIEFANLAKAAGPTNCNHPADSLEPLELIMDACVCGECGAVLKNYGNREANALGIEPGWHKMNAQLLTAEIFRAINPLTNAVDIIMSEFSQYSDAGHLMGHMEGIARNNESLAQLEKAR
jgi:hypothetical protein